MLTMFRFGTLTAEDAGESNLVEKAETEREAASFKNVLRHYQTVCCSCFRCPWLGKSWRRNREATPKWWGYGT